MSNEIMELIGKLLGAAAVIILAYIAPAVKNWLAERLSAEQLAKLELTICSFVRAAEQLYKTEDPDGTIRKAYVVSELRQLGILCTEQVNAMIEAAVFNLPRKETGGAE